MLYVWLLTRTGQGTKRTQRRVLDGVKNKTLTQKSPRCN